MDTWWDLGEWSGHFGDRPTIASLECPHCHQKGNFTLPWTEVRKHPQRNKSFTYVVLKCNECLMISFLMWSASSEGGPTTHHDYRLYPPSLKSPVKAPNHWPAQVGKAWEEAHKSLGTESWNAAAAMARRSLQAALRDKGANKGNLYDQIEELGKAGILPKPMIQWAGEIRLLGNLGAHPDEVEPEVDPQDAKDIVKFLDYFLIYSYNLPLQIEEYKKRRGQNEPPPKRV